KLGDRLGRPHDLARFEALEADAGDADELFEVAKVRLAVACVGLERFLDGHGRPPGGNADSRASGRWRQSRLRVHARDPAGASPTGHYLRPNRVDSRRRDANNAAFAPARRYRLGVRTGGSQPSNRGSNPRSAASRPIESPRFGPAAELREALQD